MMLGSLEGGGGGGGHQQRPLNTRAAGKPAAWFESNLDV